VRFAERQGVGMDDMYGDYWRMKDCEDEERRARVRRAMRVRETFMG